MHGIPSLAASYDQTFKYICRWLDSIHKFRDVSDPVEFLSIPNDRASFLEFLKTLPPSNRNKTPGDNIPGAWIGHISRAILFSDFIELNAAPTVRLWPLVEQRDLAAAQGQSSSLGSGLEVSARPLPSYLYDLVKSILLEGENGWPGSLTACQSVVIGPSNKAESIYCPVLPTLYLMLFDLPLRVGQAKRMDSGEGDTNCFDPISLQWTPNTGINAGYWGIQGRSDGGFARSTGTERPITGFFVNTNKTGRPYTIPWENLDQHRSLYSLRKWQEEYNSISIPLTPKQYIDRITDTDDDNKLSRLPHIFPLFRLPGANKEGVRGAIPSATKTTDFWQLLMGETELRWNALHPEHQIKIVDWNVTSGRPQSARYTPHGLRTAGITRLLEQGVPFEVVSKLIAGHMSWIMTARYFNPDPFKIHQMIEEASRSANAERVQRRFHELRTLGRDELAKRTTSLAPDAIEAAVAMDATDRALWNNIGYGFCPWDGSRCHDGGDCLRKNTVRGKRKNVYAPVPGGNYNCIMCRHFVTGPDWIDELELYGTLLTRRMTNKSDEIKNNDTILEKHNISLRIERDDLVRTEIEREIKACSNRQFKLNSEAELLGNAVMNAHKLLEGSKILKDLRVNEADPGNALIVRDRDSIVEFVAISGFEQAALVFGTAEIHHWMQDDEATATFERSIDWILHNSGLAPIAFSTGNIKFRKAAYRAVGGYILSNCSRGEIVALEDRKLRLQDLPEYGRVEEMIRKALSGAALAIGDHPGPIPNGILTAAEAES
ncbi:VPA1269 family protein [Bosea caraganae]|nr:VPA1269 family protein [Bosea caraganae]